MNRLSAQELLRRAGITYIETHNGKFTTECPQCGGKYLNVKTDRDRDSACWYCRDCGESGPQPRAPSGGLGEPVAIYDYEDATGKRSFQVLKFEPPGQAKQFRQRIGPQQVKWSIKGVQLVPYRLPELIEAVALGRAVFVVEGEKDVELLRSRGVPATCNAMGAGKWRDEYDNFFNDADVVICGDNDEPGRKHVAQVVKHLKEVVKRLRVLELASIWPDIGPSDDVSDWFEHGGGTVEALWAAVGVLDDWKLPAEEQWVPDPADLAAQWAALDGDDGAPDNGPEPPPHGEPPDQHVPWSVPPFVWRDGATIPQRVFLYGHAYARGFVSATIADGGVGKSILRIAECLAMASGRNLLGITPPERVRVLYWNGDDPYVEVERRIHAVCKHHNIDLKTLTEEGWLFIGTRDKQPLCIAAAGRNGPKVDEDAAADIEAFIRTHQIGLACFDPLKALHRVPENDNTGMDLVADVFNVIAERTNAAITLDHHIRKPAFGQGEATTADARGATALINKVRLSRVCNPMTTQQAIAAHIKEEDRRRYFRVDGGKGNIAPPERAGWFKIVPVLCANGQDTPIVMPWTYPNAFDNITPDHMHRIRTMVAAGSYRKDSRSEDWVGKAVAEMLDLDTEEEADRKQVKAVLKTWFANGVLTTDKRQDQWRQWKAFVVPGNWTDEAAAVAD
jgi:hypothetical protein